jgi:hypothetical protein
LVVGTEEVIDKLQSAASLPLSQNGQQFVHISTHIRISLIVFQEFAHLWFVNHDLIDFQWISSGFPAGLPLDFLLGDFLDFLLDFLRCKSVTLFRNFLRPV